MSTPRFDLVDIVQTLKRRGKYILLITISAAVLGAALYFALPKKYEATAELFVANPLYADRNNIFRNRNAEFINYFGNEDDIDKVMAIAKSDVARQLILDKQDLAKVYGLDTSQLKDRMKLAAIFKKNFKVTRTEYQGMEMSYTDRDPAISANVTNEAVAVTESIYKDFYNRLKENVCVSLQNNILTTDSALHVIDSLATGASNQQVVALMSTRDQLLKDRAQDASMLHEFSTGIKSNEMSLLRVISSATPATEPKGLGLVMTIISCAFIGLFFSAIWVLLSAFYKKIIEVGR